MRDLVRSKLECCIIVRRSGKYNWQRAIVWADAAATDILIDSCSREHPAARLHAFMVHLAVDANVTVVTQQITLRLRRSLPPFIADFFVVSMLGGSDVLAGIVTFETC